MTKVDEYFALLLYFASFLALVNDVAVVIFGHNGHVQVSFNIPHARKRLYTVQSNKYTIVPSILAKFKSLRDITRVTITLLLVNIMFDDCHLED